MPRVGGRRNGMIGDSTRGGIVGVLGGRVGALGGGGDGAMETFCTFWWLSSAENGGSEINRCWMLKVDVCPSLSLTMTRFNNAPEYELLSRRRRLQN